MTSIIEQYHAATRRLDDLIDRTPTPDDTSREAVRRRAEYRMGRLRRFLTRLGNPHEGYPIVHVGGTSGKGSTSTAIAAILTAAGYRTGLHTSPYLQTAAEKLQIDGRLIDPRDFVRLTDDLLDEHERWIADGEESLTYGEAWIALTMLVMHDARVDIAVIEVGAGGRFDLTNILTPAVSVITSVGIDHTQTLGPTIEDIAWHKAGIIKPGAPAITAAAHPVAREIIAAEARQQGTPLDILDIVNDVTMIETGPGGTSWRDATSGESFTVSLSGRFQAANGATAVRAVRALTTSGIEVSAEAIQAGLAAARIPGRAEPVADRVPILLDGAHNADKVAALTADVPSLLPVPSTGRRAVVLGALEAKQADDMIASLLAVMDVLIATSPRVLAKEAKAASVIADTARKAGFDGPVVVAPRPLDAIAEALAMVEPDRGDAILVTGSLYLVGNIREHWFREDDIMAQQTPWPTALSNHVAIPAAEPEAATGQPEAVR